MIRNLIIGALAAVTLSGCGAYGEHLLVMRANYNVSRGEFQNAIVDYLGAAETRVYEPWIAYNLGNVYHYLGESTAALEMWELAQRGDVPDLLFGSAFNRGVYLYDQGRFAEALEQFRYSLLVDSSNVAAKVNLELTLEKLRAEEDLSGGSAAAGGSGAAQPLPVAEANAATRVLDYVRRVEEQRWRANVQGPASWTPEDR